MKENKNLYAGVPNPTEQIAKTKTVENVKYFPKKPVDGYEVTEVSNENNEATETLKKPTLWLFVLMVVFLVGWFMKSRKKNNV